MEKDCAFAYFEDKYTFILQIIKVKDMCAMYTGKTTYYKYQYYQFSR
jgi:hypothetical protein